MVSVIAAKKEEILQSLSLDSMFLHYYLGYPMDNFNAANFSGQNQIAFKGYSQIIESDDVVRRIMNRPPVKGIDYSNNIYCFIGIHLASSELQTKEIDEKFNSFSLKNKFALSLIFTNYYERLLNTFDEFKDDPYHFLLNLLFKSSELSQDDENKIFDLLVNNNDADAIDIAMYDKLSRKFMAFKYNNVSSVELIKNIFNNFQDAIKHLTNNRRKNHTAFEINDEYDIQDLSYLILRSIFKNLEFENPHFKIGGTNSKVDLMIENEGIDIELKMIKAKDKDEKDFIKQLKIDFIDYAAWNGLKDLIVFVYDPFNKTTNKNNFYSLQGTQTIQGVTFNIHIIVSN